MQFLSRDWEHVGLGLILWLLSAFFLFSFVFVRFDQFITFSLQHEIAQVILKMKLG